MLAAIGIKVNLPAADPQPSTSPRSCASRPSRRDQLLHAGLAPAATYDVHNVFEALIQTPERSDQEGPVQRRRLLQPDARRADRRDRSRRPTRPSATRMIAEAHQDLRRRLRLHPAAPAGGGLGDAQEHRPGAAAPTTLPAALGDGEVADASRQRPRVPAVERGRRRRGPRQSCEACQPVDARLRPPPPAAGRSLVCWWSALDRLLAVQLRRRSDQHHGRAGHAACRSARRCASSSASTSRCRAVRALHRQRARRASSASPTAPREPVGQLIAERAAGDARARASCAAVFALLRRHAAGRLHRPLSATLVEPAAA